MDKVSSRHTEKDQEMPVDLRVGTLVADQQRSEGVQRFGKIVGRERERRGDREERSGADRIRREQQWIERQPEGCRKLPRLPSLRCSISAEDVAEHALESSGIAVVPTARPSFVTA
jgi:hypothetical protein